MSSYTLDTADFRKACAVGFYLSALCSENLLDRARARTIISPAKEMFDRWLNQMKAEAWNECADAVAMQGTVQIPDNPYKEQE